MLFKNSCFQVFMFFFSFYFLLFIFFLQNLWNAQILEYAWAWANRLPNVTQASCWIQLCIWFWGWPINRESNSTPVVTSRSFSSSETQQNTAVKAYQNRVNKGVIPARKTQSIDTLKKNQENSENLKFWNAKAKVKR